jgi:hypothetical protein
MILSGATLATTEEGEEDTQREPGFAEAPRLIENPSGRVPLAAEIHFLAAPGLTVELRVSTDDHRWQRVFADAHDSSGAYSIPVVGMKADRDYEIELRLRDTEGSLDGHVFKHRTPSLPASQLEFPPLEVSTAEPERMEPGVTFLSVRRRYPLRGHWMTERQLRFTTQWGMLVALDAKGEVLWYYESDSRTAGIDRLANGNILMHRANFSTLEIDMLGNTVREYYAQGRPYPAPENPEAIAIEGIQTLHHQPQQLPDGNYLAFSANGYLFEDWPSSPSDPDAPRKDQMVMADTVVIFNPEGEIIWSWNTRDHLDTSRIGYDTFNSYWWTRGFPDHADWSHGNGLSYYAADDSILVSLRQQLAVIKIDRKTQEIKWILGRHDHWPERLHDKLLTPLGEPFLWFGYQHNPRYTPKGNVIMFDNRAHGARMPPEPRLPFQENFSRAVEFAVDEEAMTVRQVWTTGDVQGSTPCFANGMSEAWRLPQTDNRLVVFSFCAPLLEGVTEDIMDPCRRAPDDLPYPGGPVREYAGDDVVFEVRAKDPDDLLQWEIYGGFRSPSMYARQSPSAF